MCISKIMRDMENFPAKVQGTFSHEQELAYRRLSLSRTFEGLSKFLPAKKYNKRFLLCIDILLTRD